MEILRRPTPCCAVSTVNATNLKLMNQKMALNFADTFFMAVFLRIFSLLIIFLPSMLRVVDIFCLVYPVMNGI